jgi:DNA-binding NarL/FixJ family response regulator
MLIKVLLADDSDIMRAAVGRLLQEDPRIKLVGEASTFVEALHMNADLTPAVLLMELRLPEKRDFNPAFVKAQLLSTAVIALSVTYDDEAKALAASYGALQLLDKMSLYSQLLPAVMSAALVGYASMSPNLESRRLIAASKAA